MKKYLVSYDLDKPGQDYTALIDELNRLGATKVLYSEWILRNTSSASDIRDHLMKFIDRNDKLLVVALTGLGVFLPLGFRSVR